MTRIPPHPPPRDDDINVEGVRWLDNLAFGPPSLLRMGQEFPPASSAQIARRELVNRPFPRVNYYSGKTWAGRLIHERVATQGQRNWAHSTLWDEEWFAKFEEDI